MKHLIFSPVKTALAVVLASLPALALAGVPTGGAFAVGNGTIASPDSNTLNVAVTSANGGHAVINWGDFTATGAALNFANQTGAGLNLINAAPSIYIANSTVNGTGPAMNLLFVGAGGVSVNGSTFNTTGNVMLAAGTVDTSGPAPKINLNSSSVQVYPSSSFNPGAGSAWSNMPEIVVPGGGYSVPFVAFDHGSEALPWIAAGGTYNGGWNIGQRVDLSPLGTVNASFGLFRTVAGAWGFAPGSSLSLYGYAGKSLDVTGAALTISTDGTAWVQNATIKSDGQITVTGSGGISGSTVQTSGALVMNRGGIYGGSTITADSVTLQPASGYSTGVQDSTLTANVLNLQKASSGDSYFVIDRNALTVGQIKTSGGKVDGVAIRSNPGGGVVLGDVQAGKLTASNNSGNLSVTGSVVADTAQLDTVGRFLNTGNVSAGTLQMVLNAPAADTVVQVTPTVVDNSLPWFSPGAGYEFQANPTAGQPVTVTITGGGHVLGNLASVEQPTGKTRYFGSNAALVSDYTAAGINYRASWPAAGTVNAGSWVLKPVTPPVIAPVTPPVTVTPPGGGGTTDQKPVTPPTPPHFDHPKPAAAASETKPVSVTVCGDKDKVFQCVTVK